MTTTPRPALTPSQIAEVAPRLQKHVPGLKLNKTGETGISGPVSPSTDQDIKAFAWELMLILKHRGWKPNEGPSATHSWSRGEPARADLPWRLCGALELTVVTTLSHPDPITAVILAACAAFHEEVPNAK